MTRTARLDAGELHVVFAWQGDRYAHRVVISGADDDTRLESVEGTGEECFPPSPVLTDLHVEQRDSGVSTGLLVGKAGASHWSASVEADPRTGRLTFDVACRLSSQPGWLGSTYRWRAAAGLARAGADGDFRSGIAVGPLPLDGHETAQQFTDKGQISITPPRIEVPLPRTVRWKYAVFAVNSRSFDQKST